MKHNKEYSFRDLVELSIIVDETESVDCSLELEVDGEVWTAYHVSVANRDLMFDTDKGTVTYLVDSYGGKNIAELFNWDKS